VHLIQQIGSYAGLAAIPGLAVLSALYFSQARDVRRLREWAGRAPERAAEQAQGGRVAAQPQPQAQQPAAAAAPTVQPAGAAKPAVAAAATGATAATTSDETAAPATNGATPVEEHEKEAAEPAAVTAKPGALTPAAVAAAASAAKGPARLGTPAGRPGPPAVGGIAATTPRRPIPSLPSSTKTSVLGAGARPPDPWYRRLGARLPAGRYIALIVVGALVLGGGAAFAISQVGGSSGSSSNSGGGGSGAVKSSPQGGGGKQSTKGGGGKSSTPPAINPSKVTVTVVNGTTIPNLARDTATKLSGFGFQIGNKVTGTGSLAAAESVVEYRPGSEVAARFVAAKLHITQKQPADADAIAQAGLAQVIVVLGADQAPGG
jgi:hypothetical protein